MTTKSIAHTALIFLIIPTLAAAEVQIDGLDDTLRGNVEGHLAALEDLDCNTPPWLVRWQFNSSEDAVREALEAFGHYSPVIDSQLTFGDACWLATYTVDPGPPTRVRNVQLSLRGGYAEEPTARQIRNRFESLSGTVLRHQDYETAKRALSADLERLGFFDAELSRTEVLVDPDAQTAEIHVDVDSGERACLAAAVYEDDVLRPELLDKYVPYRPGAPYDAGHLAEMRQDLIGSDYFNRVSVEARRDARVDGCIPVVVQLEPPSRNWAYTFGVGFGTDTGVGVRADAKDRLRNDRGHQAEFNSRVSRELINVNGSYTIPWKDPRNDIVGLDLGYTREDNDTVQSDTIRLGLRHSYERGDWIETDFIDVTHEDYELGPQSDVSRLVVLGTNLNYSTSDETEVRPADGYKFGITVRGAHDALLSDTSFLQFIADAKWVYSFNDSLRLLTRAEAGVTFKEDFEELPPSVRFFAGGDNSIRGFGFKRVGPREEGEVVGGDRLLVGSIEFDYTVRENWSVATFIDAGSAYNDSPDWSVGAGLGIRWFSPIGPFRVDVATPMDGENTVRLHITVGPDL